MTEREAKGLLQLLAVAEDLLFSFPLPADIVKKYEFLRSGVFAKLDWQHDFSKAWRMQREAHSRPTLPAQVRSVCEDLTQNIEIYHTICARYRSTLEDFLVSLSSHNSLVKAKLSGTREQPISKSRRTEIPESSRSNVDDLQSLSRLCQVYQERQGTEQQECTRLSKDIEGRLAETRLLSEQSLAMLSEQDACVKALEMELKTESAAKKSIEERLSLVVKQTQEKLQTVEGELRRDFLNELAQEQDRLQSEHEEELRRMGPKLATEMEERNAGLRKDLERLKAQHTEILQEERKSHENSENQLRARLQQLTEEDSEMLKELRERLEKAEMRDTIFRDVLRAVFDKAHAVYKKFAGTNSEWNGELRKRREAAERTLGPEAEQYVDQLVEVEFLTYFVQKLDSDNRWLAEKLAELSQDNEKLRRASPAPTQELHRQIWADVQQSASALKEFEQARNKLLQQFQDKGSAMRSVEL